MSESRIYPRQVWVLQPSMKPIEVTVVKGYSSWNRVDYGDITEKGKIYPLSDIFPTKDAAIQAGRDACKKAQADIDKRIENLRKKLAQLDKHSA